MTIRDACMCGTGLVLCEVRDGKIFAVDLDCFKCGIQVRNTTWGSRPQELWEPLKTTNQENFKDFGLVKITKPYNDRTSRLPERSRGRRRASLLTEAL